MYKLFIALLLVIGSALPVVASFLDFSGTPFGMYFSFYSEQTRAYALVYTILCSLQLVLVSIIYNPLRLQNCLVPTPLSFGLRRLCLISGFVGLAIDLILNLVFGMAQSNIISQRPFLATLAGYLSTLLRPGFFVLVVDDLIAKKSLTINSAFLIIIYFFSAAASSSRSAPFFMLVLLLCSLAYSPHISDHCSINNRFSPVKPPSLMRISTRIATILFVAPATIIIAQTYRYSGDLAVFTLSIFTEGIVRLFLNNLALYLAIEDQSKIFHILTDGQPFVFLSQFSSAFGVPRQLPSSFRLLEWWDSTASASESGHYAGYAYGWLGLSYGLFGWLGIVFVALFLMSIFSLFRRFSTRPSLAGRLIFSFSVITLFDFFMNLGLDSFLEKIVKGSFYFFSFYMLISLLLVFASRKPCSTAIK